MPISCVDIDERHPSAAPHLFIGGLGPQGGGWGAKRDEDGVSATVCMNDGDTHNSPVEMVETKYPIRFEAHALIPDSGGAGRRRGGLGVEYRVRARSDMNMSTQIERKHCKPWGLEGGLEGYGNDVEIAARRGQERRAAQRQGALHAARQGRRLHHALRRRRRVRAAAGPRDRGGGAGRASGLRLDRGRAQAVRRGDRSQDVRGRCRRDRDSCGRRWRSRAPQPNILPIRETIAGKSGNDSAGSRPSSPPTSNTTWTACARPAGRDNRSRSCPHKSPISSAARS